MVSRGWQCDVMAEPNPVFLCSRSTLVQPPNVVPLFLFRIHEKDGKIKSVEELLQAEILKVASKEKTVQVSVSIPCDTFPPFCVYAINYHLFVTAWHSVVTNL